jgi:hypothetical protein
LTIRYPDFQIVFPRSVELSNYQQQRARYPLIEQQQITTDINKKELLNRQKVKKIAESERIKINEQEVKKGKNFSSYSDESEQKKQQNSDETQVIKNRGNLEKLGHNIDLKT